MRKLIKSLLASLALGAVLSGCARRSTIRFITIAVTWVRANWTTTIATATDASFRIS